MNGNILISSAGRRVALLSCLVESLRARGAKARVFTADSGLSAPATYLADGFWSVPRCTESGFLNAVLRICVEQRVKLIIPTIDPELPVYAAASDCFARAGVTVCVSSLEAIQICGDKCETHRWLEANGFPTVRQADLTAVLRNRSDWNLPVIAKPRNGSASIGVRRVQSVRELEALAEIGSDYIVQEIAAGREFTVNVYVNRAGKCVCAVPHCRMEVRAGEVSKGVTVKDPQLIELATAVAERLPGAWGPLNIQCFMDASSAVRIFEINGRFGGGYPLAHRAGAQFTRWLLDELEGTTVAPFDNWLDDLAMLRYDEAVFVSGKRIGVWNHESVPSST